MRTLLIGSLLLLGANAFGSAAELKKFKATFPASPDLAKCTLCHSTVPKFNSFGADFKAAGSEFSDAFLKLDSDGDGFSNAVEIKAQTLPADGSSHPKPNTAPVAKASPGLTTKLITAKEITLVASDADGDKLSYKIVAAPQHGLLTGTAPKLSYTPNADFIGPDRFSFKANDGSVDSNVVSISVLVADQIVYISTPEKKGNDETGAIDDSSKPFASAAGALKAAITAGPLATNQILISMGEGNFGDLTGPIPAFIVWSGAGVARTFIGNISGLGLAGSQGTAEFPSGANGTAGASVVITSDNTVTFGNIDTSGGAGGDSASGCISPAGSDGFASCSTDEKDGDEVAGCSVEEGGSGGAGGAVTVVRAVIGTITAKGGVSGCASAAGANSGGAGGAITLTAAFVGSLNSSGGASSGGTGGNGGNIDTFPPMVLEGTVTVEGGVGGGAVGLPGVYTAH